LKELRTRRIKKLFTAIHRTFKEGFLQSLKAGFADSTEANDPYSILVRLKNLYLSTLGDIPALKNLVIIISIVKNIYTS
jgi:hypothetical protein